MTNWRSLYYQIQWFPLSTLIFGQQSCFLGPTIFNIPQTNWLCTYVLVFRAQDHPCSIVIKPTKGDFLHDYQNRNNLHIGLTNSKGFVVEYDSQGLHRFDTCALIVYMQNLHMVTLLKWWITLKTRSSLEVRKSQKEIVVSSILPKTNIFSLPWFNYFLTGRNFSFVSGWKNWRHNSFLSRYPDLCLLHLALQFD